MKRIILFLFLGLGFIVLISGCKANDVNIDNNVRECSQDADCVAASCCHADSCVAASQAPACNDVYCSMECAPGTLDCGQAKCVCDAGKCGVRWNGE